VCAKTSAFCKPLWVVSCAIDCTTATEQEHFVTHSGPRSEHKLLNPNNRAVGTGNLLNGCRAQLMETEALAKSILMCIRADFQWGFRTGEGMDRDSVGF
jgi:hypothetical protein